MFKVDGKLYSLSLCTTKVLGAIDHSKVIDYKRLGWSFLFIERIGVDLSESTLIVLSVSKSQP